MIIWQAIFLFLSPYEIFLLQFFNIEQKRRVFMSTDFEKYSNHLESTNDQALRLNFTDQEKVIQTQEEPFHKSSEKTELLGENAQNKRKQCPKWFYATVTILLTAFLIVEYIIQIRNNELNTSKFMNNIKKLKEMNERQENSFSSFAYFQETGQLLKEKEAARASAQEQPFDLTFNQVRAESQQEDNLVQVDQQNDPNGQIQLSQPAYNDNFYRPKSIAHQDRNQDVYVAPEAPLHVVTGNDFQQNNPNMQFKVPQTSKIYKSINNPTPSQPIELSNISPIIQPMNKIKTAGNPQGIYGIFAGVTTQQLVNAREYKKIMDGDVFAETDISKKQREYYQSKYNINQYSELPFCIVVPTFNNADGGRYLKNIKSIVMQDYTNYHVVIIDDASDDRTGQLIKTFLQGQTKLKTSQYVLIRNQQQMRAMSNLRSAAKNHCKPQDIFMIVDGDDELLGKQVLKLFNSVFQQRKLWFVYSNFLTNTNSIGYSRAFPASTIRDNNYRAYPFVTSHLRAFYTQLFLNIKEEDLKDDNGQYLKAANDVAICIPILQQSHERVGYLPEVTYYYNSNTGINNHQLRLQQQRNNDRRTRTRAHYEPLSSLFP